MRTKMISGVNDLATTHPDLLKEWDYKKNDELGIKPTEVSAGMRKKVWWKCKNCGNEWQAEILNRKNGTGCPYCNKTIRKSITSTNNITPDLLKEWDYEKNSELGIKPTEVSAGSNKKVWWKCSEGHNWQAVIYSRTINNTGCPKCNPKGRKTTTGVNDLATTHHSLLKEWDYAKNDALGIKPTEVSAGSGKKVWWICSKGHNWQAVVLSRINGTGCPYCSRRIIEIGVNDLTTTHPELLAEWDYEKNDELGIKPTEVSAGMNKMIWWKCSKGHKWKTEISNRKIGKNCPYCSNRKILSGYNDLATKHPDLLKEWDYEKNDELGIKPTEVSAGSSKKVYWICKNCNHQWNASILIRTKTNAINCPICKYK